MTTHFTASYPGGSLALLEAQLRQDLEYLELPAKPWVPARSHQGLPVRDVVVIGAGMCGLAATAKLVLTGITNVVTYDAAPAGREGPWVTFARMENAPVSKELERSVPRSASTDFPRLVYRTVGRRCLASA